MSDDNKQIPEGGSYDISPVPEEQSAPAPETPAETAKPGKKAKGSDKPQEIASTTGEKSPAAIDFDAPAKKDPKAGFDENRRKEYKDHKALQIILGAIAGGGIWCSLWFLQGLGGLFGWIWVILFGVVFIGKSQIEKKKNIYFRIFTLAMLIGLIVAMATTICVRGFTVGWDVMFASPAATPTNAAS